MPREPDFERRRVSDADEVGRRTRDAPVRDVASRRRDCGGVQRGIAYVTQGVGVYFAIMPKLPFKRPLAVSAAGFFITLVAMCAKWALIHYQEQGFWLTLVNFAVAWLPFAFSIVVAFIPDMKRAPIAMRVVVVLFGLGYSVLLWQQQTISLKANQEDQRQAIMTAVEKSNEHSDQQIATVRSDLDEVAKNFGREFEGLSSLLAESTTNISASISKVGVPLVKNAQIQFSFYKERLPESSFPLTVIELRPTDEGVYSVEFFAKNISDDASAKSVDMWVFICDACAFNKEPEGFDKPAGIPEISRHKYFNLLNPGVSIAKMIAEVKLTRPSAGFEMGFQYSCETCGPKSAIQKVRVATVRP